MTCGTVSSAGFDEVMCLTFSGKVTSFTTEAMDKPDEGDTRGRTVKENRDETAIRALKDDLLSLKAQLKEEQRKLSLANGAVSSSSSSAAEGSGGNAVAPPQRFEVLSRVELDIEEGAYGISLEVPLPLSLITLTSTVRLELLEGHSSNSQHEGHNDNENSAHSNNGILGMSPPTDSKPVLATFRYPEKTNRAHIRYRTNEGESGEVVLGVITRTSPKVCQTIKLHVKPLSLHHRVHILPSILKKQEKEKELELKREYEKQIKTENEAKESLEGFQFEDSSETLKKKNDSEGKENDGEGKENDEGKNDENADVAFLNDDDDDRKKGKKSSSSNIDNNGDNDDDNEDVKYPEMNLLKVTGNFSLRMAHDWINASLPEVPPRVGGGSKSGGSGGIMQEELYYVNSFTQSELSISYSSGFVTIKSDSASSIAILRDVIAGKARDLRVDVDLDYIKMKKGACRSMLTKIDPLLRYQLDIASKVGLIEALQEITLSEEAMGGVNDLNNSDPDKGLKEKFPWLSQELLDILNDANKLQNEYKIKPKALQYISGVLTDLFVDWYRFKGEDVRSRIPDLHNFLITDYHFEGLLNFFSLL
mmetsp:Transcript_9608/g.11642  ORF Transcript_9608/g.11642 Transcript_9608/m.11642 type:complete len:591 (+) Transcript_9608:1939-3711(+)